MDYKEMLTFAVHKKDNGFYGNKVHFRYRRCGFFTW